MTLINFEAPSFFALDECPVCTEQVQLAVSSDLLHDMFTCANCHVVVVDGNVTTMPYAELDMDCECEYGTDDMCYYCQLNSFIVSSCRRFAKYFYVGSSTLDPNRCARCSGHFSFDENTGNVQCGNCFALKGR